MDFNKIAIAPGQELAVINKSLESFRDAGLILVNNIDTAEKAEKLGHNLIAEIQENAAKIRALLASPGARTPEAEQALQGLLQERATLDSRSNNFLLRVAVRFKECNQARAPITQIMDEIRRLFTTAENRLDVKNRDSVPFQIQALRNTYVREQQEAERRKREEAEKRQRQASEAISLRAMIQRTVGERLLAFIAGRKRAIMDHFNQITLPDFPVKSAGLKNMATTFPEERLEPLKTFALPMAVYHTPEEVSEIKEEELAAYDFEGFFTTYSREIEELKRDLVDKLSAKWEELEDIERTRKTNSQKAEDLIAEQRRREESEALKLKEEQKQKTEDLAVQVETRKEGDQLMASFTHQAEIMQPAPKAKIAYKVRVKNIAGWMELFKFWAEREKSHLQALADSGIEEIEALEKKEFKSLRSYAERLANDKRNPIRIASPHLAYEEDIKAKTTK